MSKGQQPGSTDVTSIWRVGSKVPLNVYEGDRPVCQCHTESDARRIVAAMQPSDKLDPIVQAIRDASLSWPDESYFDEDTEQRDALVSRIKYILGCDCWKHEHQVCDICQGPGGKDV